MARRTIESLIALTVPEVQSVFLETMQDIVDRAILNEMVAAIENRDADALFRATGFTPAALGPILDRIEQSYKDAAEITADGFPSRIRTPTGTVIFRFNMRNPAVEADLRNNSSRLITALTEEARQNVRQTLEIGMIAGRNPRSVALDIVGRVDPKTKSRIGGVVGLTTRQAQWANVARTRLLTGDERYFTLGLRDKRFDKRIKDAMDQGKAVPAEVVERAITSYKNKALQYRGEVIGRTETLQSIARGEWQSYNQTIEEGLLQPQDITKVWDAVGDRRTRTTHTMIEQQSRENPVEFDEPFVSPSGARLMHPGDRSLGAPAEETIQCRCRVRYDVDWTAGVE